MRTVAPISSVRSLANVFQGRVQPLEGPALVEAISKISEEVLAQRKAAAPQQATSGALSYKSAGVNIDEGNALVDAIKPLAKSTTYAKLVPGRVYVCTSVYRSLFLRTQALRGDGLNRWLWRSF